MRGTHDVQDGKDNSSAIQYPHREHITVMKFSQTVAASALAATASAQANYTAKCVAGLHVIVARASEEAPGFGILGTVKDNILSRLPNSDATWVSYPAQIVTPPYITSEPEGVGNMTMLIKEYGDACPNGKMALLGYSQGAQVVGDTLLGPDYSGVPAFGNGTGIGQQYIDNIVAVVMMGDPANVNGYSFHVGNSTLDGLFPRNNTDNWAAYGLVDKTVTYCDDEDTYCARGKLGEKSLEVHIGYVKEYGAQAADFVVSKAGGMSNSTMSTSGSNSTTSAMSGSNSTTGAMSGSNSTTGAMSGSNSTTGAMSGSNGTTGTTSGSNSMSSGTANGGGSASTGSSSGSSPTSSAAVATSASNSASSLGEKLSAPGLIALIAVAFMV